MNQGKTLQLLIAFTYFQRKFLSISKPGGQTASQPLRIRSIFFSFVRFFLTYQCIVNYPPLWQYYMCYIIFFKKIYHTVQWLGVNMIALSMDFVLFKALGYSYASLWLVILSFQQKKETNSLWEHWLKQNLFNLECNTTTA